LACEGAVLSVETLFVVPGASPLVQASISRCCETQSGLLFSAVASVVLWWKWARERHLFHSCLLQAEICCFGRAVRWWRSRGTGFLIVFLHSGLSGGYDDRWCSGVVQSSGGQSSGEEFGRVISCASQVSRPARVPPLKRC